MGLPLRRTRIPPRPRVESQLPFAHQWYSELLYATGRYDESIEEARRAVELEPYAPIFHMGLGLSYMFAKRFDESEVEFRKTVSMDPAYPVAHYGLAEILLVRGKYAEAVTEIGTASRSIPESTYYRAYLGYALAKAGHTEEARKILGELIDQAKTKYVSWRGIAEIYPGLGEKDHFFAALELAYQQGDTRMSGIRARAELEPYWTSDPRFADLLKKVGLPSLN